MASMGEAVHPLDTILGAAINGGISYGIGSIYISLKDKSGKQKQTQAESVNDSQIRADSLPSTELDDLGEFLQSKRDFRTKADYSDLSIPSELKDFLRTLGTEKGRYDGWYRDPSNLYKFRYYHEGRWTLAVSDTDSKSDKDQSLDKYLKMIAPVKHPYKLSASENLITTKTTPPLAPPTITAMSKKIEQLERIAALRHDNMISELEHESLKAEILKMP